MKKRLETKAFLIFSDFGFLACVQSTFLLFFCLYSSLLPPVFSSLVPPLRLKSGTWQSEVKVQPLDFWTPGWVGRE